VWGNSNLSQAPPWLHEIHANLWGRRDLVGQIFRKANLTKTDFAELQHKLRVQSVNPSQSSTSFFNMRVSAIKSAFLHSRSSVDDETLAYFATCDAASGGKLVPQPIIGSSMGVDIETLDDDAIATDTMDNTMDIDADPDSTIAADAAYLSEGCTAVFPYTIRYVNLTFLKLQCLWRVPLLLFVRDEWGTMINLFSEREKGVPPSQVSPELVGTEIILGFPLLINRPLFSGKTCMLYYYILLLCIIRAQPILFQDMGGQVSYINTEVMDKFSARHSCAC
jgi:hypothetical protein